MQVALLLRPEQGAVIRGSGGVRKVRWTASGRGKRGGLRVIYYWHPREMTIYWPMAFAKNVRTDLTPAQLRVLRRLVEEEFR